MNAQLKPTQTTNTPSQAKHPLAGQNLSGADIVVQVLADEGVDVVFGYSGGAILPVYDAVFRYNPEHKAERGRHTRCDRPLARRCRAVDRDDEVLGTV